MSRVRLLPRLNSLGVESINTQADVSDYKTGPADEALADYAAYVSFAASGGTQSSESADAIAAGIRKVAVRHGFPEPASQSVRALFDQDTAIVLAGMEVLQTGEALRDDVWSFIAAALLPDVVTWRFPDRRARRFEGGVRNAFQRLWVRGVTLDRGEAHEDRWELVRTLSEDAMVQIFERAAVSGERRLARALAEGWLAASKKGGRSRMEDIMRGATKLVRIRNQIMDLAHLEDGELAEEIRDIFRQCSGDLGKSPAAEESDQGSDHIEAAQ